MTPEEIPQPLLDILDRRAGKVHARTGRVVGTLAEILTRYEQLLAEAGGHAEQAERDERQPGVAETRMHRR